MKKLVILVLAILSVLLLTSCKRAFQDEWVDIIKMPLPAYTTEIYCTKEYSCENTKKWNSEVDYSKAYNVDCVAIPECEENCTGHIHYIVTYVEYEVK